MTNFFSTGLVRRAFLVLCAWCAVPVVASAQDLSLSGVVSDQNGAPLIGVTVFEKDGSNGTATNQDGRYTIRLQKGATLVFSYLFLGEPVSAYAVFGAVCIIAGVYLAVSPGRLRHLPRRPH